MSETATAGLKATFDQILAAPTPDLLWDLYRQLLVVDGGEAQAARPVVRAFHTCLRNFESKTASRSASRWGAALGTAAVAGVSIQELRSRQDGSLRGLLDADVPALLETGVPALLEVGSAVKSAQAWEVEARLVYDDVAWFLYEQLWEISSVSRPELSGSDRRSQIDQLIDPALDPALPDGEKVQLVVHLFLAVLAARLHTLLDGEA